MQETGFSNHKYLRNDHHDIVPFCAILRLYNFISVMVLFSEWFNTRSVKNKPKTTGGRRCPHSLMPCQDTGPREIRLRRIATQELRTEVR